MSQTLLLFRKLVARQEVRISEHGYDELAADDILVDDIIVVWGIPKHATSPAAVVTAYRPDTEQWTDDFLRRKS